VIDVYRFRCWAFFIIHLLVLTNHIKGQKSGLYEVRELVSKKFDWLIKGHIDSFSNILHTNAVYIHSNGMLETKEHLIQNLKNKTWLLDSVRITNLNMVSEKNTIFVWGEGFFAGKVSGQPFYLKLLFTENYIRKNKKWLLVSRQAVKI